VQIDRRLISHFDWSLFLLVLSFVAIGITTIYSANYNLAAGHAGALPMRQFTWLGLGTLKVFCHDQDDGELGGLRRLQPKEAEIDPAL